jgi:superfamily I DNA/RNA helicase
MDPGEEEPGVRLGTMHRIKGLEFRAVVLVCGDADDPMNRIREAESRERCTRYVAATRAREYLLVTVSKPPVA